MSLYYMAYVIEPLKKKTMSLYDKTQDGLLKIKWRDLLSMENGWWYFSLQKACIAIIITLYKFIENIFLESMTQYIF